MENKLLLTVMIFWAMTAAAEQPLMNEKAPDFSLRDQYDRPFTLQIFSGRPVILIACDKTGSKHNGPWKTAIGARYAGRVQTVGVADLRAAPFFMKGSIKKDFKKNPAGILLDWDGALFTSYGLAEKVPNIIVIDGSGILRYLYSGLPSAEAVAQLFKKVDTIIPQSN